MENFKIKIAVLLGGISPEREVSLETGKAIYEAIKNLGYSVKLIDPAYGENQPTEENSFFNNSFNEELKKENYLSAINSKLFDDIDLVFIALHGKWGEDGTIQSLLEFKDIKYTGTGVLGSSLTMDKARSKVMFSYFGVRTPKWITASTNFNIESIKIEVDEKLNYPCIVKPNDQGSTIGLTKCESDNQLEDALKLALQYSNVALIEEFIPGREIAATILGNEVLPLLEIKPKHEIYDYECKYTDGMSEYIVPAKIDKDVAARIVEKSKLAFDALGCEHYARVDFRLTKDNKAYCFEVNTLPGMTSHSLVPKTAKSAGITFLELIDRIIKSAL